MSIFRINPFEKNEDGITAEDIIAYNMIMNEEAKEEQSELYDETDENLDLFDELDEMDIEDDDIDDDGWDD